MYYFLFESHRQTQDHSVCPQQLSLGQAVARAGNSILLPQWQASSCLSHALLLPRVYTGRKLESEVELEIEPGHSHWACRCPSEIASCCAKHLPKLERTFSWTGHWICEISQSSLPQASLRERKCGWNGQCEGASTAEINLTASMNSPKEALCLLTKDDTQEMQRT